MKFETNLKYYGFSLLVHIQKECNSKFRIAGDFFELGFDLVEELFLKKNLEFSSREVAAIGDAALAVGPGMVATLWSISQFVPDRKRSALVMVDYRHKDRWLAASVAGGVKKQDAESYLIKVDDVDCEQLCLEFMRLVRERGLLAN